MKKILHILLVVIAAVAAVPVAVQPVHAANYFFDFESPDAAYDWKTWSGKSIVRETWAVGTSLRCSGRFGMYTSNTVIDTLGINTEAWAKTGGYCVSVYHKLSLDNGTYTISLDALSPKELVSVALIQADTLTNLQIRTSTGTSYSSIIRDNNIAGLTDLKPGSWTHYSADRRVNIAEGTTETFILVITFRSQGASAAIGAAVDNIEVVKKQTDPTACNYSVKNLALELVSGYARLTWEGNAGAYQVRYFNGDTLLVQLDTVYANPNGEIDTCLVPISNMVNGVYSFMVRTADCETNSAWAYVRNKLIYDPSSHCIDYLNFDAQGVQCSYGEGSWSSSSTSETITSTNNGYVDNGYRSINSTHTLHFVPNEIDPLTVRAGQTAKLRTVPEGAFASVRLGYQEGPNGEYPGSHWQRVVYTIPVDTSMGIVLFRYAYVGETGGHSDLEQSHLRLKLTDPYGNVINGEGCGSVLFTAPTDDADMDAKNANPLTSGWHKGAGDGYSSIYWRDWTTLGVNVGAYVGQTIKIEVTNYGCGQSAHFGYTYFVLDCASGKLGGVTCGEKPREMVADEGFIYEWEKPYNPLEPFYEGQDPTSRSLFVSPNDSNTYRVHMKSKNNPNCSYYLEASAMARLPKALFNAKPAPKDCQNYLAVTNESGLFGFFTNSRTGQQDSARIEGGLNHQLWRIRTKSGLTNIEVDTSYVEPILTSNDGDSVYIDLFVSMEEGCSDSRHMEFAVPAIGPNSKVDSLILCQGQSIEYEGETYTEAGDFPLMTEKNIYGCDSTRTLHIDYEFSYIFQRWDNVLSVVKSRNPQDESEPRYEFIAFQWYRNGEPIEGATQSYYYAGDGVSFPYGDVYAVEVMHKDSTTEMSCDYIIGVSAIEDVELDKIPGDKFIHNGTLYIRANGVLYDARGRRIRNLIKK